MVVGGMLHPIIQILAFINVQNLSGITMSGMAKGKRITPKMAIFWKLIVIMMQTITAGKRIPVFQVNEVLQIFPENGQITTAAQVLKTAEVGKVPLKDNARVTEAGILIQISPLQVVKLSKDQVIMRMVTAAVR
jgi:hypothetical protein